MISKHVRFLLRFPMVSRIEICYAFLGETANFEVHKKGSHCVFWQGTIWCLWVGVNWPHTLGAPDEVRQVSIPHDEGSATIIKNTNCGVLQRRPCLFVVDRHTFNFKIFMKFKNALHRNSWTRSSRLGHGLQNSEHLIAGLTNLHTRCGSTILLPSLSRRNYARRGCQLI